MSERSNSGTVHIDAAVLPYPYTGWTKLRKAELWLLQTLLDRLPRQWDRTLEEAGRILGARTQLREAGLEVWQAEDARGALRRSQVLIVLEHETGAHVLPIFCELATELAARLVDRVLGGEGQIASIAGEELDELSAGVAGYLVARLCAASGALLRMRSVLTDSAAGHQLLESEPVAVWPLALSVGGTELGWLRVFIPARTARGWSDLNSARRGESGRHPAWLGPLSLQLCAHAARMTLAKSQLRALGPGDVVVPRHCSVYFEAGGLSGEAQLHVVGARLAHYRCTVRDRELVLHDIQACTPESVMSETHRIPPQASPAELATLSADAPIELCLELARFTLRLDQLGALRPGQVLGVGQPVGKSVRLSAGGRAIARGELVEIEGEIGLRILELTGES